MNKYQLAGLSIYEILNGEQVCESGTLVALEKTISTAPEFYRITFFADDGRPGLNKQTFDLMVGSPSAFRSEKVAQVVPLLYYNLLPANIMHTFMVPNSPLNFTGAWITRVVRNADEEIFELYLELEIAMGEGIQARLQFALVDSFMSWTFQSNRICRFMAFLRKGLEERGVLEQVPDITLSRLEIDLAGYVCKAHRFESLRGMYSLGGDAALIVNTSYDHLIFQVYGIDMRLFPNELQREFMIHYTEEAFAMPS